MKQYLLDTNICIFFLKGLFNIYEKVEKVEPTNCFLSEITVAELKFGAACSDKPSARKPIIEAFIQKFPLLPITNSLDFYAEEKTRLRKAGLIIDEFDLLIGATAVTHNLIMVTNNISHFNRISQIKIEDWSKAHHQP